MYGKNVEEMSTKSNNSLLKILEDCRKLYIIQFAFFQHSNMYKTTLLSLFSNNAEIKNIIFFYVSLLGEEIAQENHNVL